MGVCAVSAEIADCVSCDRAVLKVGRGEGEGKESEKKFGVHSSLVLSE